MTMETKSLVPYLTHDSVKVNEFLDTQLLRSHSVGDHKPAPILLAMGESFLPCPSALLQELVQPFTDSSYTFSMYGVPDARRTLRGVCRASERWLDSYSLELAVSWTGTRLTMYDFFRYVKDLSGRTLGPAVVMAPGYDYDAILTPIGFTCEYLYLQPGNRFAPKWEDFKGVFDRCLVRGRAPSLIVINPQHNPTGHDLGPSILEKVFEYCIDNHTAILVDNAYFGVLETEEHCTSAMQVISEVFSQSRLHAPPFLAVRTLGKLFRCNGWGLGTAVARPEVLDTLMLRYRPQHSHNTHAFLQNAMARFITSQAAADFVLAQQAEYRSKATVVNEFWSRSLKYPHSEYVVGQFTPYLLAAIPTVWHRDRSVEKIVVSFITDVFNDTGVLLTGGWARPQGHQGNSSVYPYYRVYLGGDQALLSEAMNRLGSMARMRWNS